MRPVLERQLFVDVAQVELDGVDRNLEVAGQLIVGPAAGERGEQFAFLVGQGLQGVAIEFAYVDEVEKILLLVDFEVGGAYAALVYDPQQRQEILATIREEYDRTVDQVLRITDEVGLAQRFPNYRSRLERRLPILNQVGRQQADMVGRLRARRKAGASDPEDFLPLLLSINCVASGLGWTG